MAQLQLQPATTGKKNRTLKAALRIDMTPMVDLGFLLITFFVFTSSITSPMAGNLIIPADGGDSKLPESVALSVVLGEENKVYAYNGMLEDAMKNNQITQTNYHVHSGIGNVIRKRQQELQQMNPNAKDTLMLLIKPTEVSTFQNLVDALDEVLINKVTRYVVMEPAKKELEYISKY